MYGRRRVLGQKISTPNLDLDTVRECTTMPWKILLRKYGVQYESERIVPIPFEGHVIGNVRADIIINNTVVLEFKTIRTLNEQAECQIKNYLNLTGLKIGYLDKLSSVP
jgi:GxxExxY protein